MGEFASTVWMVVLGVGGLLAIVLVLYGLANLLPKRIRENGRVVAFLLPAVVCLLAGLVVPAIRTIWVSLQSDTPKPKFAGLDQYRSIFTTAGTQEVVVNSLTWVVVGTLVTTLIGLSIARFTDGMRAEKALRSIIFIPGAISLAGAGIIWKFVYAAPPVKVGLLNQVTKIIPGLPDSMGGSGRHNWLLEQNFGGVNLHFNTLLLIVIFIWVSTGFATVVFSAAVKGVPEPLIEAAKMDGANNSQAFYKVTLPYIRATIVTVATTTTIAGLKSFDIVAATTGGNFHTATIANGFFDVFFIQNRSGLGSALAVLMFVLVIPIVIINRRAQRRAEEMIGA